MSQVQISLRERKRKIIDIFNEILPELLEFCRINGMKLEWFTYRTSHIFYDKRHRDRYPFADRITDRQTFTEAYKTFQLDKTKIITNIQEVESLYILTYVDLDKLRSKAISKSLRQFKE